MSKTTGRAAVSRRRSKAFTRSPILSGEQLEDALHHAHSAMKSQDTSGVELEEYKTPGEGLVLSAFWTGGNLVVLYDGKTHVDIEIADEFEKYLQKQIFLLDIILRDEQPRGIGRVVNFDEDIEVGTMTNVNTVVSSNHRLLEIVYPFVSTYDIVIHT
jgi:hypothetical protein